MCRDGIINFSMQNIQKYVLIIKNKINTSKFYSNRWKIGYWSGDDGKGLLY